MAINSRLLRKSPYAHILPCWVHAHTIGPKVCTTCKYAEIKDGVWNMSGRAHDQSEICTFKPAARPLMQMPGQIKRRRRIFHRCAPRRVIFRWIITKCSIMTENNHCARQPASKHEQSAVCFNSSQFNATPGAYTDKKTCCVLEAAFVSPAIWPLLCAGEKCK